MSNAASKASSAGRYFREVQNAASDPATTKLAQGLLALAQAVEELAREQQNLNYTVQTVKSRVS